MRGERSAHRLPAAVGLLAGAADALLLLAADHDRLAVFAAIAAGLGAALAGRREAAAGARLRIAPLDGLADRRRGLQRLLARRLRVLAVDLVDIGAGIAAEQHAADHAGRG